MLQCPICSRNGFQRLTRHFSQVHGLKKQEVLEAFPDIVLEVDLPQKEVKCSECGVVVLGLSSRAAYVKCQACRKPDPNVGLVLVECLLCGKEARTLQAHLRAAHSMNLTSYRAMFPDALTARPESRLRPLEGREKQSKAAVRRWSDPSERESQSERLKTSGAWIGKNLSKEHRAAISAGGTGVVHNVSVEGRRIQGQNGRSALILIRLRPGHGDRLSKGQMASIARNPAWGFKNPLTFAKGFETRKKNGTLLPKGAGRGIGGFRKDLSHYTRSTLEANFARILRLLDVPYEYEPKCFKLGDGRHYTPDFHLSSALMEGDRIIIPAGWVELKGWRTKEGELPGGTQEKIDALRALVPGESVAVIVQSDDLWRRLEQKYAPLIELWETPRRNLRTDSCVFGTH